MEFRNPLSSRKMVGLVLLLLAIGMILGIGVYWGTQYYLVEFHKLATHSPSEAINHTGWMLKGLGITVSVFCFIAAYVFFRLCRRAIRTHQMPPPGPWSWGALQVLVGKQAVLRGQIGLVLCVLLVLCGIAAPIFMWRIVESLMVTGS